jgi:hypothetical protein
MPWIARLDDGTEREIGRRDARRCFLYGLGAVVDSVGWSVNGRYYLITFTT